MKRVAKFQEGGTASSGISNEPVGAALRRLFQRRAPMQGPLAPGGGQRPQEDRARMAEEAAPRFDEEERRYMEGRRNQGSAITNQPVGERLAGRRSAPRPAPMGDYEDRMQRGALPAGRSAAPGPMGEYGERAAAGATPPRPRATPRPMAREATTAEDLNEIVLRLTRGEKPVTETEKRIADRMGIAYKKGGMVKKYREGGEVTDSNWDEETNRRQIELNRLHDTPGMTSRGRGKVQLMGMSLPGMMHPEDTKDGVKQRALREELRQALDRGEDVEIFADRVVRRNPQRKSFKTQEYKKGGMVKPKTAMKPKAPATKMKAGGKVAPKKMMKGGIVAKPKAKKMMGGGRAMYAKGGMARGCK